MRISVIVPTYKRCDDLLRCLNALTRQIRTPDVILIVVRNTDVETRQFLDAFNTSLNLRVVDVESPGQVAALNAGLQAAQNADIVSITDDDAAPHCDWLEKIEMHFCHDSRVGGVGGRDWTYVDGRLVEAAMHPGASDRVGCLQWFGRTIGNHHICEGNIREVDILKGANMSFRSVALSGLRFDSRLKGTGAQVCNDMGFSLAVKRAGWKLLYDPSVSVDHYPGKRFDEDQRRDFNSIAQVNLSHNETLVTLENLSSWQRVVFIFWSILIGTRSVLGVLQFIRFSFRESDIAWDNFCASMEGRWQGLKTWLSL
jgi:cellulose synthase/poly-beta-1,6-N-acetylglucosamine synthase-like glycosyltransferase